MTTPGPYDLVKYDGKTMDRITLEAIHDTERILGYELDIAQGCYQALDGTANDVKASAGTHDGGGVVDLLPWDHERKVRALRKIGFAAWFRPELWRDGKRIWGEHIHAVLIGNKKLAPAALRQVDDYRHGLNGLANGAPDPTWRPSPIPIFTWPPATQPAPLPPPDIDGVDISHHQARVLDFVRAREAGVKFVVHKATEGTNFFDDHYTLRRGQVAKAGLIFGAYHFARPSASNGKVQARYFLNRAKPVPGDLRPVLDIEVRDKLTDSQLEKWVADFAAEVVDQLGVRPIIYTPFDFVHRYGPLWVARYSDANTPPRIPKPWSRHAIWQFSNGRFGRPNFVPGLGAVDINTLHPDASLKYLRLATRKAR